MKKIPIILFLLIFRCIFSQHSLTVQLGKIQSKKGVIMMSVYNSDKNFLSPTQYVQKLTLAADQAYKGFIFKNLPTGKYAVALCHDENNNGKCDRNAIGFPTEGYGFSRNFKPRFSAPKFKDTFIELKGNTKIMIEPIY